MSTPHRGIRLKAVAHEASPPSRTGPWCIAPDAAERRELNKLIRAELQKQGRIGPDSRTVPVLVELELRIPKLQPITIWRPDPLQDRQPGANGIPHHGVATVVSTDAKRNLLTVKTSPASVWPTTLRELRTQTAESKIYREELRELATGDRIRFTASDREHGVRRNEFATVESIGQDHSVIARLDNGKTVSLNPDQASHIEYGYTVEGGQRVSADRILATGEALDSKALAGIPAHARDVSLHTSDVSVQQKQQEQTSVPTKEVAPPVQQQSRASALASGSNPSPPASLSQ